MGRGEEQTNRKRHLLDAFRAAVRRDGAVPGIRQFAKEIGEKKHTFEGTLWESWSLFVAEAGFQAGEFQQAISEDDLLRALADLTRRKGRFPASREIRFAGNNDPKFPHETTLRNRFRRQSVMAARLRAWVTDKADYQDVLRILGETPAQPGTKGGEAAPQNVSSQDDLTLSDAFVPPVIALLPEMAIGHPAAERACRERGTDLNVEFERRVGTAFQLLGFDVEGLGQGAGRVADGIARCAAARWAVVYDAKVRRAGFIFGTEDRKFREYLEHHAPELQRGGVDSVYFAVVSSSFDDADVDRAREIARTTKAKAVILLEAQALRALVDLKLRTRCLDDWAVLERIFIAPGIINLKRVTTIER